MGACQCLLTRGNAVRELLGQSRRVFALSHGMAALPLGAWTRAATLMVVADRRGRCCASVNIARWPRAPMVHRQRRQLRPMVQTAVDGSPPIHLTADGCTPRLDTCHEYRMLLPRCPVNAFRVHCSCSTDCRPQRRARPQPSGDGVSCSYPTGCGRDPATSKAGACTLVP